MSAAAQTKIFGMRVGVDPKILIGGLFVLVAVLFWYNSRSDETDAPATAAPRSTAPATSADTPVRARRVVRRPTPSADRGTLRFRPVDATRGDIDPTLRTDLLTRLQSVAMPAAGRNVFEFGAAPASAASLASIKGPRIVPKPLPQPRPGGPGMLPGSNEPPPLNLPFKYYGFAKATNNGINRGFFLDGDNVLVGAEGETLKAGYLVVELSANTAKIEDMQAKRSATLTVVPAAQPVQ